MTSEPRLGSTGVAATLSSPAQTRRANTSLQCSLLLLALRVEQGRVASGNGLMRAMLQTDQFGEFLLKRKALRVVEKSTTRWFRNTCFFKR